MGNNADWRMTGEECAVKMLGWDQLVEGGNQGKIENPRTEISAMVLLRDCYDSARQCGGDGGGGNGGGGLRNASASDERVGCERSNAPNQNPKRA